MAKLYQAPMKDRFGVPIDACDVEDKRKLESYRVLWLKWMAWYDHAPDEPHSIEQQIQFMLFNDLIYRSLVSARASVPQEIEVSARTSTLAYLLDSGYVTTQVLAVTKLLDPRRDVISVMRLLNDIRSRRKVITREIYVSGTGFPYEPKPTESDSYTPSPEEAEFGLTTSNHYDWIQSYHLHETFDRLSGKNPSNRSREDVISDSVFKRLHSWLDTPSIQKLDTLRDKLLAHAANATQRAGNKNEGVRFTELDEAQGDV